MDEIVITNMTLSDFNAISPALSLDFDNFWSAEILESELNNENSYYIVAKIKEEIVGFAGIWKSVDEVHITDIVVKKIFRHKGIGSLLLQKLILLTKEFNFNTLTLEVNSNNEIAKKLYLKFGFKELGIRKKYYHNKEDAIIMTLYI